MRFNYCITALALFPLCAFSQPSTQTETVFFSKPPVSKNTTVRIYSNELKSSKLINRATRTIDYPTQIIRTTGNLKGQELNCDQVNDTVQKKILDHIANDHFTYNMYIACDYNPDNGLATQYKIYSYFDPLTDEAIQSLETYLKEYNGYDLMGTKLNIEPAKGLIISLNIAAGTKKNFDHPPFVQFRQDRSNFFFKSDYEMRHQLFKDISQNFLSNDPDKILPFLDKWVFLYAGSVYRSVLRDSNYAELQPERIFLMEHEGDIFVSNLKYYFAHNCTHYENHRCLKQSYDLTEH